MKQLLSTLLAVFCVAILLCSCGGGNGDSITNPTTSQDDATAEEGQGSGNSTPMSYGEKVGEYLGVAAYSNGNTHETHPNDYFEYGHRWQCAEYG